jgi:hypothetical protein
LYNNIGCSPQGRLATEAGTSPGLSKTPLLKNNNTA